MKLSDELIELRLIEHPDRKGVFIVVDQHNRRAARVVSTKFSGSPLEHTEVTLTFIQYADGKPVVNR